MSEAGKVVHVLSGRPYDAYVGRANGRAGVRGHAFQNPYRIGVHGDRSEVLRKFEALMRDYLLLDAGNRRVLMELRGKTLACWCAPKDGHLTAEDETVCHGQTLLKLAEELAGGE